MIKSKFETGSKVIYPSYGLGEVLRVESQLIYGMESKVYVISFDEGKVVLSVPVQQSNMLRVPMHGKDVNQVYDILRQPPNSAKTGMKTNQIYENRIKSGDLTLVAQTVKDLYKKNLESKTQSPSYNQKKLFDSALKLIIDEVAEVEKIDSSAAKCKIMEFLNCDRL